VLPLSRQTLDYVAGIIRRHRISIGSLRRKLNPGQQALLVLAYLRKGETFAELAAGFGIGTATAWRYVTETVALLAARSPKLRPALATATDTGHAYLVIDGTLIPIDRVAADRPFYSGKHRKHGMNLQVIATPDGDIVWVSGPLPGAVHDLTAARIWGIVQELAACGLIALGDKGYIGEDDIYPHALPRPEQARLAETGQPRPCPAPRPRRTRQRPAQVLAHLAQAPLLPLARRATGQGDPRPSDPRNRRMKRLSAPLAADAPGALAPAMPVAAVNGIEISYTDSGGQGPAVVFSHGYLMDHTMFDRQVTALAP
jgi:DDE superfamily endonuclease/Helix-turn-helix of DDE superfamily endonuclease